MKRGTGAFCIIAGAAIPVLWGLLLVTGQITNVYERAIAYAFHWTAEGLSSILLVCAGVAILRHHTRSRRLFFLGAGALAIAALGMLVYYALLREPPFVITGAVVAGLTAFFVRRNGITMSDNVYAILGVMLYALLTSAGNALHTRDTLSAVYLLLALALVVVFTLARFLRLDR
ncbi:MAG: hypothetical protein ACOC7M_00515 [Chloroflexota bacterium]